MGAPEGIRDALADRYTFERELGRGGMAVVHLAHDRRHDRPVALKVLLPELAASLGPERFQREIRFAARLQHPNILTVLDSGEAAEGQRGVGILPASKDRYTGPYVQLQLARIYVLLGEQEKALDQLEPLLRMPYYLSPGWLRIDLTFDPLRKNPRFMKLVAGTA
jgi:serine/threonine protein kinase